MRTLFLCCATLAALGLFGCSGSSTPNDAGTSNDAGVDAGDEVSHTISVSGTVALNPIVAAAYDAGILTGTPPAFDGSPLYIDEPLTVIGSGVEAGRLVTSSLDDSGTFNVPEVPTDPINIGLVGTIGGLSPDAGFAACDADTGTPSFCEHFAPSASLVWEDYKPTADITDVPLYGVPVAFTELLADKLGEAPGQHALDQGLVLGYVVAPDGGAMAGVTFNDQGDNYNVRYFDDDFNPVTTGGATNRYGMFAIIAPGQPDITKPMGIDGYPDAKCHFVGSTPGTVFNLVYDARRPGIDCH